MLSMLENVPDLHHELRQLLRQIPQGRVTTYGKLAQALGDSGAARWVGEVLVDHAHDDHCCCHRVVRVDGDVGLYISRDSTEKIARLMEEGVAIQNSRVQLSHGLFDAFVCSAPLAALRRLQEGLHSSLEPLKTAPKSVAGIDVSYISPTEAVAAYVLLELPSLDVIWSTILVCPVRFPYITGFLSFRELPMYVSLFGKVREADRMADVTFVDGNGILHPRRAGIASCVGIATNHPTIGVGKKLILGQVNLEGIHPQEPREIVHLDEVLGYAMAAGINNRPFFVSPGHMASLENAKQLAQQVMTKQRLPRPIMLADRISREVAKVRKAEISSSVSAG